MVVLIVSLSFTVNQGDGGGGGEDGGGGDGSGAGSGSGGPSGSGSTPAKSIPPSAITQQGGSTVVQVTGAASQATSSQVQDLIAANAARPVVVQGTGYTITFPRGSMSGAAQSLDFGLVFRVAEGGQTPYPGSGSPAGTPEGAVREREQARGTANTLVLVLDFAHSGSLPGLAEITVTVGREYSGRTLHYYYNPETHQLEYRQSAVVDQDGRITVSQDRCSEYVLVTERLDDGAADGLDPAETRLYGESRYDTAAAIALAYFPDGADTVVLARGDVSADALPAVPLAKLYNAPLLLTELENLPESVLNAIKELDARKVVIIGGPGAIRESVEEQLRPVWERTREET